jgi:hypothetical protein
MTRMQTFTIGVPGGPIRVDLHVPSVSDTRAVVLMVHGGPGGDRNGPSNLFEILTSPLTDRGVAVARFDLRGSGATPTMPPQNASVRSGIIDVDEVFAALTDRGYEQIVLCAESLGATMSLLACNLRRFYALVLLWPALNPTATSLEPLLNRETLMRARQDGFVMVDHTHPVGLDFLKDCLESDCGKPLRWRDITRRVLLIHGRQDQEVPCYHSVRAAALCPHAQLNLVDGGHGLADKQPLVVRYVTDFVDRAL